MFSYKGLQNNIIYLPFVFAEEAEDVFDLI